MVLELSGLTCGTLNKKLSAGAQSPERQTLEKEIQANAAARGFGHVTDISNYRWVDSSQLQVAAEVTVRYAKHAPGLDHTNNKRYRAVYSKSSDGAADLCCLDPV